jgi:cytochrome-b5 reductase
MFKKKIPLLGLGGFAIGVVCYFYPSTSNSFSVVLNNVQQLNKTTFLYTFDPVAVPSTKDIVCFYFKDHTMQVVRPYTPLTLNQQPMSFVIKHYSGGILSNYLHRLTIGNSIDLLGPFVTFSPQVFLNKGIGTKEIVMIAGGTGITPMMQMLQKSTNPNIHYTLMYANSTADDILLKNELEALQKTLHLDIIYFIDKERVNQSRINDVIKQLNHKETALFLVCGPPG